MATNTATGSTPAAPVNRGTKVSELETQQSNSNLEKLGVVNWLGASYSGADIKAVVHLYDTVDGEERIAEIESQKKYAQSLLDGLYNLNVGSIQAIIGVTTSLATKRDAILSGAGLFAPADNAERQAGEQLIRMVMPLTSAQQWLLIKGSQINQNEALIRHYEDQIAAFQDIQSTATKTLGELQTISIETYRQKSVAPALGTSYPKRIVRGPRTIAGSMIFTTFDRHVLLELMRAMQLSSHYGDVDTQSDISTYLPDQIPPFDMTIVFANEHGNLSEQRLYGVEFVNDSVTYSIEDLISENVNNFLARDVDVMRPKGRMRLSQLQRGMHLDDGYGQETTGSSLLFGNAEYEAYIDMIGCRRRKISL